MMIVLHGPLTRMQMSQLESLLDLHTQVVYTREQSLGTKVNSGYAALYCSHHPGF